MIRLCMCEQIFCRRKRGKESCHPKAPRSVGSFDLNFVVSKHIRKAFERIGGRVEGEHGAAIILNVDPGTPVAGFES